VLLLSLLLLPLLMLTLGAMELMLISFDGGGKCAVAVLAALALTNVDVGSHGADAGGSCRGGRLISFDRGGKCADAVLAALAVANVDIGSHGADAGGSCHGRKLIFSDGGGGCGLRQWMLGIPELALNLKGSRILGGFFVGRTLLGPDPSCQLLVFAALRHFFIKVRKPSFLSLGSCPW
jgi:hypothetical protein